MKAIENGFVLETTEKRKDKARAKKWDKYLADYKNYFKEYKRQYKNAQKGDEIALSQYPYLRAKWEVLKERILKAHGNRILTDKQIQKVVKINMKIVKACF
ncbi:MAG TPA: hypothetical protein VIH09_11715 [Flavobacterium sp.]|uniref:hypothetical protein n=1 Tax=Flavobacterium sp. TaxID=239 RepID=UPI002F407433